MHGGLNLFSFWFCVCSGRRGSVRAIDVNVVNVVNNKKKRVVTLIKNGQLFAGNDHSLWSAQRRSIRIGKVASSLRLEKFFWLALERIAELEDCLLSELITQMYDAYAAVSHEQRSFASYLRVSVARYLDLIVEQELPIEVRGVHRNPGKPVRAPASGTL